MIEAKAREIHEAKDLTKYTHDELRDADLWVRDFALTEAAAKLSAVIRDKIALDYAIAMVRCHYGSLETDYLLQKLGCYPNWLSQRD